ncbi:MAG TPA: DinB family protein [Candidatus Acidoferrales bacterium]
MREEIRKELELFGFGPSVLQAALRQLPKKMWCYQPRSDRWSIHDIVIHLADAEANAYIRCRGFIAEPGNAVPEFDSGRWRQSLGYFNQSVREALDIIIHLRKATHKLLCALPDHTWENNVTHPRLGTITLKRWMTIQERHIPHHIEHMRENYNSWSKLHPARKPATIATPYSSSESSAAIALAIE